MRFLLLAILLPLTASAVPLELNHQGRLMDITGTPLDGQHDLTLRIYEAPSGGTHVWEETHTNAEFDAGYFNVALGSQTSLTEALFDADDLWLALVVDTGAELPTRLPLNSVPFAIRAGNANTATTADTALSVDWANVTGAPTSPLSGLSCSTDDVPTWSGAAWVCGNPLPIDASDITTGIISRDRLPVGTGTTDVAGGIHTHDGDAITGGVIDAAYLPVGDLSGEVAAGDHTHTLDDLVGGGELVLGDDGSCDNEGELAWDTSEKRLKVCDDAGEWQYVVTGGLEDGFYSNETSAKSAGLTGYWLLDNTADEYPGFGGRLHRVRRRWLRIRGDIQPVHRTDRTATPGRHRLRRHQ